MVLEATDHIGGRIREDGSTNLEAGASWIQGIDLNDPERHPECHPIWREWLDCDEDGPDGSPTPDITFMYNQSGDPIDITQYYTKTQQQNLNGHLKQLRSCLYRDSKYTKIPLGCTICI